MNSSTSLKSWLQRHPKLNYLQRCIRQINNTSFMSQVIDIHPMLVEFEQLGELNRNINIYLFDSNNNTSGFFARYRYILDSLYFADRFHFVPVVSLDQSFIYSEKEPVNGTTNPFEYYFEPVSSISVANAKNSYNVVRSVYAHTGIARGTKDSYLVANEYILRLAQIQRKYIRLNKVVRPKIEGDISALLKKTKTLGVQVRGTDFNLNFNNHPVAVLPEDYLPVVKKAVAEHGFQKLFLATDEVAILEMFQKEFGDMLVYYEDVIRSVDGKNVVLAEVQRENHRYLLGFEVLRDMWTLASCEGLVAGVSQISICAQITKASFNDQYQYLCILDKGINSNAKECGKYYRKKL